MSLSVQSRTLARMDYPYAIAWGGDAEPDVCYVASEQRDGGLFRACLDGGEPERIATEPGGCMAVVPLVPAGLTGLLAVEHFFPIFQSAGSGASLYTPPEQPGGGWTRRRVFDLPFLHRLALVCGEGVPPVLVAGQLCREKEYQDDWRSAGAVYQIRIGDAASPWPVCDDPLLDGLHRNHGMFVSERGEVYIGADEGVFRLFREPGQAEWRSEHLVDEPVSDMWLFDFDGDGEDEMLAILPFHGDCACIFKRTGRRWSRVWETEGAFGHALWAGELCGRRVAVLGWRGGGQTLDLHTLMDAERWRFEKQTLARDIAPLNILVRPEGSRRGRILATLGAPGAAALFTVSAG